MSRLVGMPLVLVVLLALLLVPVAAAAADDGVGGEDASGGDGEPAVDVGAQTALQAAQVDPAVAGVLAGREVSVESTTPWGGTAGQPAGYTVQYRWDAAQAAEITGDWPLLRSDSAVPEPPYTTAPYRIVAHDVTGLQVDVLLAGPGVLQVKPVDAETRFVLDEQTWRRSAGSPGSRPIPGCWRPSTWCWRCCSWCAPGSALAPGTGASRP